MKLEDQVCSLELAKRLKQLGVKQDGIYQWCSWLDSSGVRLPFRLIPKSNLRPAVMRPEELQYDAFTVAELGEMLPKHISVKCSWGYETSVFVVGCVKGWWIISYRWSGEGFIQNLMHEKRDRSEADARAKMLIHLIEKGIVKL